MTRGPLAELALLGGAARAAGEAALAFWRRDPASTDKPDGQGPVSEADLASDAVLRRTLLGARPGHGWLSEESAGDPSGWAAGRAFVVDPIDGTRAFLEGSADWAVSAALIEDGRPLAGVVHLPARGETYAAARGHGATLDGAPIRCSARMEVPGARVLANKAALAPALWPRGVPPVDRHFRSSLAWRLCLAASGRFDAMLTLREAWSWDIAAGALIASEAGCTVTDRTGAPLDFRAVPPRTPGCVVAPPALHGGLIP